MLQLSAPPQETVRPQATSQEPSSVYLVPTRLLDSVYTNEGMQLAEPLTVGTGQMASTGMAIDADSQLVHLRHLQVAAAAAAAGGLQQQSSAFLSQAAVLTQDPSALQALTLPVNVAVKYCTHPDCGRQAMPSTDGQTNFCLAHIRARGLIPGSITCNHPGCSKRAVPGTNKITLYCIDHIKLYGFHPRSSTCQVEGCDRLRETSADGQRIYCITHMRQMGLEPRQDKQQCCQHPGCRNRVVTSTDGQRHLCTSHLRQAGLQPLRRRCQQDGCTKEAKTSSNGQRLYCKAHMREHGLQLASGTPPTPHSAAHGGPTAPTPRCLQGGCRRRAVASSDGTVLYCHIHLTSYGLQPVAPPPASKVLRCQMQGCTKRAMTTSDGSMLFCTWHLGQMGLLPQSQGRNPEPPPEPQAPGIDPDRPLAGVDLQHAAPTGSWQAAVTALQHSQPVPLSGLLSATPTSGPLATPQEPQPHVQEKMMAVLMQLGHAGTASQQRLGNAALDGGGGPSRTAGQGPGSDPGGFPVGDSALQAVPASATPAPYKPVLPKRPSRGSGGGSASKRQRGGKAATAASLQQKPGQPHSLTPNTNDSNSSHGVDAGKPGAASTAPSPSAQSAAMLAAMLAAAAATSAPLQAEVLGPHMAQLMGVNTTSAPKPPTMVNGNKGGHAHQGVSAGSDASADDQDEPVLPITRAPVPPRAQRGNRTRLICQHSGCTKRVQGSVDGSWLFCITHMKLYGLRPSYAMCQEEGCTKRAKRDSTGVITFCVLHMRSRGLLPMKNHSAPMSHPGPALADDKSRPEPVAIAAASPAQLMCGVPGCREVAAGFSADGGSAFCSHHLVEVGLVPAQVEGVEGGSLPGRKEPQTTHHHITRLTLAPQQSDVALSGRGLHPQDMSNHEMLGSMHGMVEDRGEHADMATMVMAGHPDGHDMNGMDAAVHAQHELALHGHVQGGMMAGMAMSHDQCAVRGGMSRADSLPHQKDISRLTLPPPTADDMLTGLQPGLASAMTISGITGEPAAHLNSLTLAGHHSMTHQLTHHGSHDLGHGDSMDQDAIVPNLAMAGDHPHQDMVSMGPHPHDMISLSSMTTSGAVPPLGGRHVTLQDITRLHLPPMDAGPLGSDLARTHSLHHNLQLTAAGHAGSGMAHAGLASPDDGPLGLHLSDLSPATGLTSPMTASLLEASMTHSLSSPPLVGQSLSSCLNTPMTHGMAHLDMAMRADLAMVRQASGSEPLAMEPSLSHGIPNLPSGLPDVSMTREASLAHCLPLPHEM